MLSVAKIDRYDMVNNPGDDKPAFSVWFSGCSMECKGCYNPNLWKKEDGREYMAKTLLQVICLECDKQDIDTVVLIGGEPLEQNIDDLSILLGKLYTYNYKIWLYTGHEFDDVPDHLKQYLYTIKCGRYDESLKQEGFPSSSNQKIFRIINGNWQQITL